MDYKIESFEDGFVTHVIHIYTGAHYELLPIIQAQFGKDVPIICSKNRMVVREVMHNIKKTKEFYNDLTRRERV